MQDNNQSCSTVGHDSLYVSYKQTNKQTKPHIFLPTQEEVRGHRANPRSLCYDFSVVEHSVHNPASFGEEMHNAYDAKNRSLRRHTESFSSQAGYKKMPKRKSCIASGKRPHLRKSSFVSRAVAKARRGGGSASF